VAPLGSHGAFVEARRNELLPNDRRLKSREILRLPSDGNPLPRAGGRRGRLAGAPARARSTNPQETIEMVRKSLLAAAILVAFTGAGFAATKAAKESFWVAQNTKTKACEVVTKKPDGKTLVQVGKVHYSSKTAAESALKAAKECAPTKKAPAKKTTTTKTKTTKTTPPKTS